MPRKSILDLSTDKKYVWLMVLTLLVAAALRLVDVGGTPPGLYHDEAYNGLDALKVLDGDLSLYFSANNGREPLFIYLIALSVGVLGRSPWALRLAAFAPGLLTVAATYALARTLFSRRVGLLSAAVLSLTLWHVHLSRVGFRAVLLPLFVALTVWQGALGWRSGRRRHWLAAGALYGLSFYTYMAVRFTPLALLLFALYLFWTKDERRRTNTLPLATPTPLCFGDCRCHLPLLAFLVTVAPLALYTLLRPDIVLARTNQVAVWDASIHGGDFWGTLATHTTRTLGMFFWRGDRIWRHNLPWRPVFDPLLGVFFLAGLARTLRLRQNAAMAFLVLWTATMVLPTLLAEDAPHFLRGVGVLPLVALFPALGMDWLLGRERVSPLRVGVVVLALLVGLTSTAVAYFGDYARAEQAAYWFESGAVELAGEVNGFLDSGWDGAHMRHGEPAERHVYVDEMLWSTWPSLHFLLPHDRSVVSLLPTNGDWPVLKEGQHGTAIFVWPYESWRRIWEARPPVTAPEQPRAPVEISVRAGALSQGDRDPHPYTTYRALYIIPFGAAHDRPTETLSPVLARFQGGVELVEATVEPTAQGVRVRLRWYATAPLAEDYTIFVHYVRDGQRLGQGDAQPAGGHYSTSRWRAGELINDDHLIILSEPLDPSRDQIFLGFYRPETDQRLDLLDHAGNPAGTYIALPINEILQ
jgi:4-amino-4-deoxy-L-arabinose transferase-like glycosyltransferase